MEYLRFIIDLEKLITYLSIQKKNTLFYKCRIISKKQDFKISDVASFKGTQRSTFPAKEYRPLNCRAILKDDLLKVNKSRYNSGGNASADS